MLFQRPNREDPDKRHGRGGVAPPKVLSAIRGEYELHYQSSVKGRKPREGGSGFTGGGGAQEVGGLQKSALATFRNGKGRWGGRQRKENGT